MKLSTECFIVATILFVTSTVFTWFGGAELEALGVGFNWGGWTSWIFGLVCMVFGD
jgi:hypothetical protein